MRIGTGVIAVVLLLALGGCGSDDSSDSTSAQAEEARAAVQAQIDGFADHDFEKVCEVTDAQGVKGLTALTKTDTCPEAFAAIFRQQDTIQGGGAHPVDDFVKELQDYKVGKATPIDDPDLAPNDWQVELIGPKDATSFLVEEDGEIKVHELFNTLAGSDAPAPGEIPDPGG
jgi:hypothetical protein